MGAESEVGEVAPEIRVAIVGSSGRMGQASVAAVQAASDMDLILAADRDSDLRAELERHRPEVVVDFTTPDSVESNLELYLELGVRPVIGTTGLASSSFERLAAIACAKKLGGVVAPNFAIGAVLMIELSARVARHYEACEIIELHHPAKLDAPSGTALKTAQRIREANPGLEAIPTHSVRLPGFLAHQEVIFGGRGERLTLRHDTSDRECFMPGVLLGIRQVRNIEELLYGLEGLLNI